MTEYTFDKLLELRNVGDGAETATAAESGLSLPVRMAGDVRAVFHVTALDTTSGNETYALSVETDSLAAFTDSPVKVGELPVTATGIYELPLSGRQIETLDPNAAAIRCKATLGGTTPSITYGAFLVPA
jgi:hypothetical protein